MIMAITITKTNEDENMDKGGEGRTKLSQGQKGTCKKKKRISEIYRNHQRRHNEMSGVILFFLPL
jgi:hypothetical protein